ncbi:MAG: energy transducer TonB, partial [Candidatus Acidiferrales bacterium]
MRQGRNSRQAWDREWLVEEVPWYRSLWFNLRDFLHSPISNSALPTRAPGAVVFRAPRLGIEIEGWQHSFLDTLRSLLRPDRTPQVAVTSKPVPVPEIWQSALYRKQSRRTALISALAHVTVLLLAVFPFARDAVKAQPETTAVELVPIDDISDYKLTLPPSPKKAGGGGGGGERNPLPASKGRLPKFSLRAQLTPPAAVIRNPNPKLTAEPTVVVPPNIKIDSPNMPNYGDPLSASLIPSGGPGSGGGIGTGSGGGVGSGGGPGVGPGFGGGTGGGAFRIGGSVSAPTCIYCPDPEYSEEARKARHQGVVVLWAVVDENGRAQQIRVQKSLGLGLDEAAVRAVQNWRFRPAQRFEKA